MAVTLEVESTLTDRYQTTVPETVRRALKLSRESSIYDENGSRSNPWRIWLQHCP